MSPGAVILPASSGPSGCTQLAHGRDGDTEFPGDPNGAEARLEGRTDET